MKKEGKTIEGVNTLRGLAGNAKIKNYPLMNFLYQFIVLQTADLDELKKLIFTKQY